MGCSPSYEIETESKFFSPCTSHFHEVKIVNTLSKFTTKPMTCQHCQDWMKWPCVKMHVHRVTDGGEFRCHIKWVCQTCAFHTEIQVERHNKNVIKSPTPIVSEAPEPVGESDAKCVDSQ